jgi:hypothetical protein
VLNYETGAHFVIEIHLYREMCTHIHSYSVAFSVVKVENEKPKVAIRIYINVY